MRLAPQLIAEAKQQVHGDAEFRRKNNSTIYDNAGIRWWFKYREEPAFKFPPSIIDKYHNNILSIRDVMDTGSNTKSESQSSFS